MRSSSIQSTYNSGNWFGLSYYNMRSSPHKLYNAFYEKYCITFRYINPHILWSHHYLIDAYHAGA